MLQFLAMEGTPIPGDSSCRPQLPPEHLEGIAGSIPPIPLPNGRHFFFMLLESGRASAIKQDPHLQTMVIGDNWHDVFFGKYQYWHYVFDARVTENIHGVECLVNRKIADVAGRKIHGIHVPAQFMGHGAPNFDLPNELVGREGIFEGDLGVIRPALLNLQQVLLAQIRSNPKRLFELRPRQFEEIVCEILYRQGWTVELTPETRDGGYDIFAISNSGVGIKTSWLVECKRYSPKNKVGVEIVRSLCGVKEQIKAANAMIVTTSTFTRGAVELATKRWDLSLQDYNSLLGWIKKT